MSLLISILKAPDSVVVTESSRTFDSEGGTIGRGRDNLWILDDPERYLSTHHCKFSYENGQFFITDLSTNGTFYNGSEDPIGKGNKIPIKDQDTFILGDYEFSIKVLNDSLQPNPADVFSSSPFGNDIANVPSSFSAESPFASGHVSSSEPLFGEGGLETDPLAALDKARGGGDPLKSEFPADSSIDPFSIPTQSDNADPLNQQISWPDSVPDSSVPDPGFKSTGAIPDDWDDDLLSGPSPTPENPPAFAKEPALTPQPATSQPLRQAKPDAIAAGIGASSVRLAELEQKNAELEVEVEVLRQQLVAQKRGGKINVTVDTSLIDALGFADKHLVDAQITQINQLAGEVLREMVKGLMQVLGSRSSIKNEFRMNVTTIQPVENNPLKFSANVDDALENMFLKQGKTFKKPIEAVREGFEGVAEHQVAILAGIREAFKAIIERFDPVLLEERFAKNHKGGLLLGSQKARNWEAFVDYYNELVEDIDKSFQYLYGDGFVRAYEDQLQKLAISRKSKKFNS
jgi:type VI secretion system FHA domain protein